jgi:hypothetical protein
MVTTLHRISALSILSALIGFAGWHGEVIGLAFLPFLFFIWRCCRNRLEVFGALLSYYAAAGRGLLQGATVFFAVPTESPSWWIGAAIWLVPSALLALAWACCWDKKHLGLRLLILLIVLSVPPLGIVGWANPLTSAGALFPALGWFGLGLTVAFCYVLAASSCPALVLAFMALAGIQNLVNDGPTTYPGWVGVDTNFDVSRGINDEFSRLKALQKLVSEKAAASPAGAVLVLPELVGGDWSINRMWWDQSQTMLAAKGQTVLLGVSEQEKQTSLQYTNKIVSIGAYADVSMVDRVPVPVSMWKPWADDGAVAPWFQSGVGLVGTTRVAHLICYEQLLMWPVLVSMANAPDILLGASNGWWARGTSIPAIQKQVTTAWARAFNKYSIYARNN